MSRRSLSCRGTITAAIAAAVACLAAPAGVRAQKTFAIPESPAFTYLNITPASVSRPAAARAFGTAVLDGISPSGEVKQGLALDVAPWTFLPGVTVSLEDYQQDPWAFILANAQLSLATARSAGDSADTDLGAGLRLTLIDRADPMANPVFTNELRRRIEECSRLGTGVFPTPPDVAQQRKACLGRVNRGWREEWARDSAKWNAPSLGVAFAGGWRFDQSLVGKSEWRGVSGWVTGGIPIGTFGLIAGQFRYDLDASGADDGLMYGTRAFVGTRFANAFFELGSDHRGEAAGEANWTGGLEFRAAENMWLSTGFGSRPVPGTSDARTVVIADLRWNITDSPTLVPRGPARPPPPPPSANPTPP
jgi:hypothetical protein